MHGDKQFYSIGEAARMIGVSASTLRAWERERLIAPRRTESGYRQFSLDDLDRLRKIRYEREVLKVNPAAIRRDLGSSDVDSGVESERVRSLGRKLRKFRLDRRMSLKEVSSRAGVSISFLSAVERGVSGVSLATLHRLFLSYGVTLDALVEHHPAAGKKMVRSHQRPVYLEQGGTRIESLINVPASITAKVFKVQPGAGSEGAYFHEGGEELMLVLEGTLDIWLDEVEHYHLEKGDSLYFPSTQSHRWENKGDAEAAVLWVNTPPTF